MPESFIRQPLQQLALGLSRYRRNSDDELIASASWLQGPQDDNLAILLEPDTDLNYPMVQGFIQLLPQGGAWRLGLNFWANTQGHYLPDFFEMHPPPPSPQRVAVIEATSASLQPMRIGALPQELLVDSASSAFGNERPGPTTAFMRRQQASGRRVELDRLRKTQCQRHTIRRHLRYRNGRGIRPRPDREPATLLRPPCREGHPSGASSAGMKSFIGAGAQW